MKIFRIFIVLITALFSISLWAQDNEDNTPILPSAESIESFYTTIDNVPWELPPLNDDEDFRRPCTPAFMNNVRNIFRIPVNRKDHDRVRTVLGLYTFIDFHLSEGRLKGLSVANIPGLANPVRDRILDKLDSASSQEEYIAEVAGENSELEAIDYHILGMIKVIHNEIGSSLLNKAKLELGRCKTEAFLRIERKKIDIANQKVIFELKRIYEVDCKCRNNPMDLDNGSATLKTIIEGDYSRGLRDFRFTHKGTWQWEDVKIRCCVGKMQDEAPRDADEGQDDDDNNNDDDDNNNNDETGQFNPFPMPENCCDNETVMNSIGFIPIINFGNNFEDSTIGIGVEYTRNMGSSFGNNHWRLGAGGLYASSSAQDGEITENYFEGNVFAENRTPILPCVQWTQRITANYGLGTLDFFENQEDFSQFTVGINTGLNLDITNSVSIFGDANLIRFGKQTLEASNGMDIDTDIGDLTIGQAPWRIGVRFRFD